MIIQDTSGVLFLNQNENQQIGTKTSNQHIYDATWPKRC